MVLFNSTTFVSLIFIATSLLGSVSAQAESFSDNKENLLGEKELLSSNEGYLVSQASADGQTAARRPVAKNPNRRPGAIARYGLGFVTIPQTARLLGSGVGNGNYEVATETNGLVLSYDYEHRVTRWMFVGGGGLGFVGVRAKSSDASLDYSYSKDSSFIAMISGTAYYITSPNVRFGIGLKGVYGDFDLPTVDISGTTYKFDYGPTMKMFASADLNWQLSRQWMFTQSMMSPLSKQAGTGWLLAVKRSF